MKILINLILSLVISVTSLPFFWVPTLVVDAADTRGEISSRASGYLYGLAEYGVPSLAMVESVDVSSVSQKAPDGLQHPIGDIDHVIGALDSCDYTVVYLQDCFDTWYYCHDEIMSLRSKGEYDWRTFIAERFLPQVKEQVEYLSQCDYADRVVLCLYNECDNAVWFGDWVEDDSYYGGWCDYNDVGRQNFYEAWKITYDYVKSINTDLLIGGPGFCDYETGKTEGFFTYCAENNCLPDICIYHELNIWSIPDWQVHVDDYRRIEKDLGMTEREIIVTEYACPDECGAPSAMLHYIKAIEDSGVYGNVAYWRLANNLNDTTADNNTPNSNWWLYRRYTDMEGQSLGVEAKSLRKKHLYEGDDRRYPFTGIACLAESGERIEIICNGGTNNRNVRITNLDKTSLGSFVRVTVELVNFKGISGEVFAPVTVKDYTCTVRGNSLTVNLGAPGKDTVCFVTVAACDESIDPVFNTGLPVRYEFENGRLLGDAYTYDSWYATTGLTQGMVGGMEKQGDGVELSFSVKESGLYDLDVIFGNSNDGSTSADRDFTQSLMTLDGESRVVSFPNTVKSECTECMTFEVYLKAGCHTLRFENKKGTYVLDSLLVTKSSESKRIAVLDDADRSGGGVKSFLAVAPTDGFYRMSIGGSYEYSLGNALCTGELIYLERGLNFIDFYTSDDIECIIEKTDETGFCRNVTAADMTLDGTAALGTDKYGVSYVEGISNKGGAAEFNVSVPESGAYRLTFTYSNNREGGVHSYNVDLIETYVTVSAGGRCEELFCRNTCSDYTYKTATVTLSLEKGENTVRLTNSGAYTFNGGESFAPRLSGVTVNKAAQ